MEKCEATLATGAPCTRPGTRQHEGSRVCGVHHRQLLARVECPICLLAVKKRAMAQLDCGHCFHTKCIRSWFRGRPLTCPMCRAPSLEGMCLLGGRRLAPKLTALLRTVPPLPRAFFPTYIISHLEDPKIRRCLGDDKDLIELLIDLACECFTKDNFFAKVRAMGL